LTFLRVWGHYGGQKCEVKACTRHLLRGSGTADVREPQSEQRRKVKTGDFARAYFLVSVVFMSRSSSSLSTCILSRALPSLT